jgi:hypothetical protein
MGGVDAVNLLHKVLINEFEKRQQESDSTFKLRSDLTDKFPVPPSNISIKND